MVAYLGGKHFQAKQFCPIINSYIGGRDYYEPFMGSCNITARIRAKHIYASDVNKYIVAVYNAYKDGLPFPETVSPDEYKHIRDHKELYPDHVVGFVGFALSFGGKFFGGYAKGMRGGKPAEFNHEGLRNLERKFKLMQKDNVTFETRDYRTINPINSVIYCDPPYINTTGYLGVGAFDHEEYYCKLREWGENNIVLCSEYYMPPDFEVISTYARIKSINNNGVGVRDYRDENLYILKSKNTPVKKKLVQMSFDWMATF